jgi:S-adenosylmethionine uptake transporter
MTAAGPAPARMPAPEPARATRNPPSERLAGVSYVFAAYFLYAVGDAAAKWLVESVPVWQVLFLRSWLGLAILLVIGRRRTAAAIREFAGRRDLMSMNLANFGGWSAYYFAAVKLPLPQLYTAYYLSPIFTALLAGPMLGERIRASSWVAGALGFVGVLVTMNPLHAPAPALWPAALGVASAAMWALSAVLYRRRVHHCSSIEMVVSSNLVIGALSAVPCALQWQAMDARQLAVLPLVTVAGLAAQFLYIRGIRRVSVAVAGPISFFSLVWSVALAFLVWGDLPHAGFLAGSVFIVSAGALVLAGEWRRSRSALS